MATSLAARTVHVKIYPTARTFAERREVLRVLERYGEVAMFRSLKYHPKTPIHNAFLSIFNDEQTAKEIINASPIRYRLITEASPTPSPSTSPKYSENSVPPTAEARPQEEKVFELSVSPSRYDHELHISKHPLHGPYKPMRAKFSYLTSHLAQMLPKTMWSRGLADWETDRMAWRRSGIALEGKDTVIEEEGYYEHGHGDVEEQEVQRNTSGGDYLAAANRVARKMRREKSERLPRVMGGLKGYWKETEKEQDREKARNQEGVD